MNTFSYRSAMNFKQFLTPRFPLCARSSFIIPYFLSQSSYRYFVTNKPQRHYDVFIIGGGVTGCALFYQLTHFTNIKSIGLAERRKDYALVSSGPNNNSQTIHCGDIETNYSLEKARSVKRDADMLRNYATKLPESMRDNCVYKMQKMVLAVGDEECDFLEKRFNVLKTLFPAMSFVSKDQLRSIEPNTVQVSPGVDRPENLAAIFIRNEHSAVNYYNLTHSFIKQSQENFSPSRQLHPNIGVEVKHIARDSSGHYILDTTAGTISTQYLVVSACGYSLLMAQKLGFAKDMACFPVAGSFYFSKKPVLESKVYTVQDPKLPFAAVHGDPDVSAGGFTRFGPTALPLPLLERSNYLSFFDYLKVSHIDTRLAKIFLNMFHDPIVLKFALKNLLFEVPYIGTSTFLHDVKKIIPGMTRQDLIYAQGFGGIRPQLIDKTEMRLIMGEGKIVGENAIFNVTPSPGGTTCLGNGEKDMRNICKTLGATINENLFNQVMLQGEYPTD